jgi:beta-mannosidase
VPPDELPGRLDDAKYEKLIGMARDAHINIFRVWGGGNREREAFYQAADRAGIMLWQEFPFACVYVPPYPTDKKFLGLVEQEVSEIELALRNHPSVILYSGGNEFVVEQNRKVVEAMRKVVSKLDPARRFIAASPAEGDSHNWIVWHQKGNLADYFADDHALMSEFGIQALPDPGTIEKYISPGLRWPLSGPVYKHHDLEYGKIMKYISVLPHDENLASYVHASQEMQAYYYQRAIEHWRIRKYRVSGTLFWMFDESWPGMVGSVVDYELKPKLAYERMKDTYNPVLIAADLDVRAWKPGDDFKSDIFLVNDTGHKLSAVKIEAYIGGKPAGNWTIDSEPDSSIKITSLQARIPLDASAKLELFVKQDNQVVSHNLYDLSVCDSQSASQFAGNLEKLTKKVMAGEKKGP